MIEARWVNADLKSVQSTEVKKNNFEKFPMSPRSETHQKPVNKIVKKFP